MLFNSYIFIFIFLPFTLIGYFFLNKKQLYLAARIWLVLASLFYYSYWKIYYLPIILSSVTINYVIARAITARNEVFRHKKTLFIFSVLFNLSLLGFFKYYNFFILNTNQLFGTDIGIHKLLLPLGISFFTFQQIAYLVDCYYNKAEAKSFSTYVLFVTYFPQLIAGPIVHHAEMMPQF